jgi:hypothetical protein
MQARHARQPGVQRQEQIQTLVPAMAGLPLRRCPSRSRSPHDFPRQKRRLRARCTTIGHAGNEAVSPQQGRDGAARGIRDGSAVVSIRDRHDGSQYTSIRFTEHLELEEITPSIGTVGVSTTTPHEIDHRALQDLVRPVRPLPPGAAKDHR